MKHFAIVFAVLAIILSAGLASAAACMVTPSINMPLMPDSDCDGYIDQIDNCPFITNPLQQDSDGNGLGNACDIYLEHFGTSPSNYVYTTRAFTVTASFHNNREYNIRNMRVNVFMPDLGIESSQEISNIDVCESKGLEFNLRAPICAPEDDYPIYIEASFLNVFGLPEKVGAKTTIHVVPDKNCDLALAGNSMIGNTFIDVMEIQDVYKGMEAVFPIKISNMEFNDKEYVITVTGLSGWGGYRLTPNSLIIVPSGSQRIADLYISAQPGVPPGERVFVVTVQSGEEFQRFLLIANVKEQPVEDRSVFFIFGFKMVMITLLVALILLLIAVGAGKALAKSKAGAQSERLYYE